MKTETELKQEIALLTEVLDDVVEYNKAYLSSPDYAEIKKILKPYLAYKIQPWTRWKNIHGDYYTLTLFKGTYQLRSPCGRFRYGKGGKHPIDAFEGCFHEFTKFTKFTKEAQPQTDSPFRDALELMVTLSNYWTRILEGLYSSGELPEDYLMELQDHCVYNSNLPWATGISLIDAADAIVKDAISNGNTIGQH